MIYHDRFNDCVKWSLEIEREGRTQEYVSDKLHEHGVSVCGVTRSMLIACWCVTSNRCMLKNTRRVLRWCPFKVYWWCVSKSDVSNIKIWCWVQRLRNCIKFDVSAKFYMSVNELFMTHWTWCVTSKFIMSYNDKMVALKFEVISSSKFLVHDMIALWNSDR